MARPKCCRRVVEEPRCKIFKPIGIPVSALQEVTLSIDEFEAIRLADFEGLYQDQAAQRMNVSRQTFGRIVAAGRRKVIQVLIEGFALRIEGGKVEMGEWRTFQCEQCEHRWSVPYGTGGCEECPVCKSTTIRGFDDQRGSAGNARACRKRQ